MSAQPSPTDTRVLVSLHLPASVLAAYQDQAASLRLTVADLISQRLASSLAHNAQKPLYFNDADRQTLESLLCRNLSTPAEVINDIRRALSVTVEGVEVPLNPRLVTRLRSRFFGPDWDEFVRTRVREGLEEYAGMR